MYFEIFDQVKKQTHYHIVVFWVLSLCWRLPLVITRTALDLTKFFKLSPHISINMLKLKRRIFLRDLSHVSNSWNFALDLCEPSVYICACVCGTLIPLLNCTMGYIEPIDRGIANKDPNLKCKQTLSDVYPEQNGRHFALAKKNKANQTHRCDVCIFLSRGERSPFVTAHMFWGAHSQDCAFTARIFLSKTVKGKRTGWHTEDEWSDGVEINTYPTESNQNSCYST